jgi:cytochrome c peroxidase
LKHIITILLVILFALLGLGFINAYKKPTPIKLIIPKGWPKPVYNFSENPLTKEGFELGKKLFYDERLSKDSTTSCGSCHQQFAAFSTYDHNLSHGISNALTTRNAPALQNLAWQKDFMADGSVHHLDEQPITPITASIEMGERMDNIIIKLKKDASYKLLFKAAFGTDSINQSTITKALSQFMLMLVSSNSKYDKVMRGEAQFILPEQLGYDIFKQKCASCHKEPMFTDYSYRNIGMPLDNTLKDLGRMKVTGNNSDSLKFRVPSLRNVILSFPYGHDGRFFTLYNVFEHYRKNMIESATTDSLLKNKLPLSNYEIGQLTSFLYTLTDTSFIHNPLFSLSNDNIEPKFRDKH